MDNNDDEVYLTKAIDLAKKADPYPNPKVGCLILKGGKIIGRGFHRKPGDLHAERIAINSVKNKKDLKDSSLYVTLEPCSHYGRTPPCTNAIINSKIMKVVIGIRDPTDKVNGIEILIKHNILTKVGVLKSKCRDLNPEFFRAAYEKRPIITLKVAMDKNGCIGITGERLKITGQDTDVFVHKLRAYHRGILVGIDTILNDNPLLDVRYIKSKTRKTNVKRQPVKIILDSKLKIPEDAHIFDNGKIILCTTNEVKNRANRKKLNVLGKKARILFCKTDEDNSNYVSLGDALKKLYRLGIDSIIVEGGAKIHQNFMRKGFSDRAYIFVSESNKCGETGKNDIFASAKLNPNQNNKGNKGGNNQLEIIDKVNFRFDTLYVAHIKNLEKGRWKEIKKIYGHIKNEIMKRNAELKRNGKSVSRMYKEFLFCQLTPQSRAKTCWEAVKCLIATNATHSENSENSAEIIKCLGGVRFQNNKSRYIMENKNKFSVLIGLIKSGMVPRKIREWIVQNIKGMGYKEASHFLRNIGMGKNLAILDRHILKNLLYLNVIRHIPGSLGKTNYLEIENKMRTFASEINIPFSHLDFVLWYKETGEIFK